MSYYEEDNPESPHHEAAVQNEHEELMEMLGGIFVQLSRIYDVLITDSPNQYALDTKHSNGELFASPPTLKESAWNNEMEDEEKE